MARDRIDNASSKAEYVRLTFADRKTAKRADRVAYFDFDIEEDARIMRRSRLDRVRGKLEANGIAWSESETSLTTEQVEDMQDREPANERSPSESERRCELIEAETDELERHRWEVFYEADGVKVLGESFVPDHEPLMHFSTVGDRPGIGDLYVSWDAEQPNEMNQSLRRVVGLGEHGSFELGPAIPRSEWPEEMRGATLPVKLRVDRGKVGEPGRIALLDGGGKEIFSYVDQGAREGWHERRDMIVDAIEKDRARVIAGPDAHALDLWARLAPGRIGPLGHLTGRVEG